MLDTLLKLDPVKINKALRNVKPETKRYIFNGVYTLTEELGLEKVLDYKRRVELKDELIKKFPETVFWDHAELIIHDSPIPKKLPGVLVSTNGDVVLLTATNKFFVTPAVTKGANKYRLIKSNYRSILIHRIIASTFIPIPNRLLEKETIKLQVNHKNEIKYHNKVDNLEWVSNQENQKHYHGHERYKEEDYFLFKIVIENGFEGREFILPESELSTLGCKISDIRNKITGLRKNIFWGMTCSSINFEDIKGRPIGIPEDILKLFHTNHNYFDTRTKPVMGVVLQGKHKGLTFSLFGCAEISEFFNRSHVHQVARGGRASHKGCTFSFTTHKKAIPIHGILTKDILKEVRK